MKQTTKHEPKLITMKWKLSALPITTKGNRHRYEHNYNISCCHKVSPLAKLQPENDYWNRSGQSNIFSDYIKQREKMFNNRKQPSSLTSIVLRTLNHNQSSHHSVQEKRYNKNDSTHYYVQRKMTIVTEMPTEKANYHLEKHKSSKGRFDKSSIQLQTDLAMDGTMDE